jgi:hypothetical protein
VALQKQEKGNKKNLKLEPTIVVTTKEENFKKVKRKILKPHHHQPNYLTTIQKRRSNYLIKSKIKKVKNKFKLLIIDSN